MCQCVYINIFIYTYLWINFFNIFMGEPAHTHISTFVGGGLHLIPI